MHLGDRVAVMALETSHATRQAQVVCQEYTLQAGPSSQSLQILVLQNACTPAPIASRCSDEGALAVHVYIVTVAAGDTPMHAWGGLLSGKSARKNA
eukprot:m.260282 g.260282  ORF g.260282 m.260282 type:complete len:96 (-) comp19677_c0_seq8:1932-2219(-)